MIKSILCGLLLTPIFAHADEWTGRDKTLHLLGGAAIGAAVTAATDDPAYGIASGAVIGLAKELYDTQHRATHTPSAKDLIATVAGAAVGSYATHLVIRKDFIGYRLNF